MFTHRSTFKKKWEKPHALRCYLLYLSWSELVLRVHLSRSTNKGAAPKSPAHLWLRYRIQQWTLSHRLIWRSKYVFTGAPSVRHIVIVPPWGRSVTDFRCGWCLESFSFLTKSRFTPPCPRTFATATAATNIVNFMKKINHVVLDYTISLGVVLGHPKTIWFKSNALPSFPFHIWGTWKF